MPIRSKGGIVNIRRGMFRFWVLFTIAWLIGCGMWAYGKMTSTRIPATNNAALPPGFELDPTSTRLQLFRQQYPQYKDMSDAELANALHSKFYSDMSRAEFDRKIGAPLGLFDNIPMAKPGQPVTDPALLRLLNASEPPSRLALITPILGTALGVPALIFIVGYALGWAFSGFRNSP
jgi:hypothetical protein